MSRAQIRSDHHRRQRPLGAAARAAGDRGAPRRRRRGQGAAARRGRARDRGADRLLLLDRELDAPDRGGRGPDGDVRRADRRTRRRSSTPRACGCASSAAARGSPQQLVERMEWAEEKTAANDRIVFFVAFNYGGRAEIVDAARSFEGGSEEEFRSHLYAPEMHDPDLLIRTSGEQRHLQLPALAVRLLGAGLPRRALAGLRPGRVRGLAARVRDAPAALRGPLDDRRPLRRRDVRGRAGASRPRPPRLADGAERGLRGETAKRIVVALPWIAFAIAIIVAGGLVFAAAMIAIGVLCLREYLTMTADSRPLAIPAYVAVAALIVAAHFGTSFNVLLIFAASFPLLFVFGADARHRDGVTVSMGVTLLGIVWIGIPLVHAVLLRDLPDHGAGAPGRRPGRHLRRRHRRLRDRAHVRQPQNRSQPQSQQDDRGADRRLRDRHHGLLVRRPLPGLALRESTR